MQAPILLLRLEVDLLVLRWKTPGHLQRRTRVLLELVYPENEVTSSPRELQGLSKPLLAPGADSRYQQSMRQHVLLIVLSPQEHFLYRERAQILYHPYRRSLA